MDNHASAHHLAVGLTQVAMNQNGAPIRLVVPWKSTDSRASSRSVQIKFVEKQPSTAWNIANPQSTVSIRT